MGKRATLLGILLLAAISACAEAAVLGRAKNVVIDSKVTRKRIPLAGGAPRAKAELVLRNIQFQTHPGTQFHVVIERVDDPTRRARVGTLSFYMTANTTSRTFDVTDELRQIGASSRLREINVVFEATTGRGGANAEGRLDPDAKVTVGEIVLRVP